MTQDKRRQGALQIGNYAAARATKMEIIQANRVIRDLAIALKFADEEHIKEMKLQLDRYVFTRKEDN